jgi:hypothetical protein
VIAGDFAVKKMLGVSAPAASAVLHAFTDLAPQAPLGLAFAPALLAAYVAPPQGGVEYHECPGVCFRAACQGNKLANVVQQP